MRIHVLALAAALAIPGVARGQQAAAPAPPPANPADVGSLDAILKAVYDVISGPAGTPRDWNRMRSLFIPEARLGAVGRTPDGRFVARMGSLQDWMNTSGVSIERNGFFEREIYHTEETFGHVTHVFSTYESRRLAADEKPFARGINSIQLLNDGSRWWVVTIYWQQEGPGIPIPEKYLPK